MPQGKAVSDDLNAPLIRDRDIHVGESHMAGNAGAGFATDPRDGMLKRQRSRCEDAGGSGSPSVSSSPWQRHLRGARGRGSRSLRSRRTRNCALGMEI